MSVRLRRLTAALLCLALLPLGGCFASPDALYRLPEMSDTYALLQDAVDQVLAQGAEYASPGSGSHRQAVQLEDLDGDGVNEAVAFFKMVGDREPLKLCVFRETEDGYQEALRLGGEGTGFDRVAYADLNGDGSQELLVGLQVSGGLKVLCVWDIRGGQASTLLSTDYTDFLLGDLTGDGLDDTVVIRMNAAATGGEAELYTLREDGEVTSARALLSNGAEALARLRLTALLGGGKGVLAESVCAGGLVTDLLAWRGGTLSNVTLKEASGVSERTVRSYAVYAADLDGDGALEIPEPRPMTETSAGTVFYQLDWYTYGIFGQRTRRQTTYHNYSDGWYLVLEDDWRENLAVRRKDNVSGERAVVFSVTDGEGNLLYDWLAVYTLSGDNREERARLGSRFLLRTEGSTLYAAELLTAGTGFGAVATEESVRECFHIVYSDWETGES